MLNPGIHITWPLPIDKVYRFRTEQIQSFIVGSVPEEKQAASARGVVDRRAQQGRELPGCQPRPFARPHDPLRPAAHPAGQPHHSSRLRFQYQVTNLVLWAYENEDAPPCSRTSPRGKSPVTSPALT